MCRKTPRLQLQPPWLGVTEFHHVASVVTPSTAGSSPTPPPRHSLVHLDFSFDSRHTKKTQNPVWISASLRLTMTGCFFGFSPPPAQVKNVFDQEGFSRQKRGYRNINDIEVNMSDPLFTKQWYLVSNQPGSCPCASPDLSDPGPHSSALITRKSAIFPATP